MKKTKLLLFFFLISIVCLISLPYKVHAFTYKPGDILVTNSSSSKGLSGHVGIVIEKNKVLHTSGWKNEPYPKLIKIETKSKKSKKNAWFNRYPKTKVIRPTSEKLGKKASKNAMKYFHKKIPYSIKKTKMKENKITYCSHLVWYSYYKSGKNFKTKTVVATEFYIKTYWDNPLIITPYDFIIKSQVKYNGFKIVDNKW